MTKQNKAEMFREAATMLAGAPRFQELLNAEADRIDKMNEKRRKSETKTQKENRETAELITTWFEEEAEAGVAYDGAEVKAAIGLEISPQKFAAVMKLVAGVEKTAKADSNKDHVGYKKA